MQKYTKAIVSFVSSGVALAALIFGFEVPDFLTAGQLAGIAAAITPLLVYFLPNKDD